MSTRPEGVKNAIVISATSDIGGALVRRWRGYGWDVRGTYRTRSRLSRARSAEDVRLVPCDLSNPHSVDRACAALIRLGGSWDVLALLAGTMEPIGPFRDLDVDAWARSISVNFANQLRVVHRLLPAAASRDPVVLFFAGGGTNSATRDYSAYTVSKIALIKMCEILDAEIPRIRFTILGPGWVKTKIHDETRRAAQRAVQSAEETRRRYADDDFTRMDDVLDCCDWVIRSAREVVGGRNVSVANDAWADPRLDAALRSDRDMYKLRRYGNDRCRRSARPEGGGARDLQ